MSSWNLKIPEDTPRRFVVLLYRQWEAIDVFGPLEALNTLSRNVAADVTPFQLTIVAADGIPASTAPITGQGSKFNQRLVADTGYHYDPNNPNADLLGKVPEADVLLVPGGLGPPDDERPGVVEFIRQYYKKYLLGNKSRYLFTVCTGSGLAAQAGCLDKIYATTNKTAFNYIAAEGYAQLTYWIAKARWVDSGNIWTTSGVSAGTDGMIAWMTKMYGEDVMEKVTDGMEWIVMSDPNNDKFSKGLTNKPNKSGLPDPN